MSQSERGFTLLEILVAFVILALSLSIVLRIFSAGTQTALVAESYSHAVSIAESLLAETGVEFPLQAGSHSGITHETYHWQVDISPYVTEAQEDARYVMMQVHVEVSWGHELSNVRTLELKTLKWANRAVPS